MGYDVYFPTPLAETDPNSDNIDVCLRLDDGREYTFVVATPDNLKALMRKDGVPYIKPGLPFLIAEKLTEEVISRLVGEIADDEAMLRIYGGDI